MVQQLASKDFELINRYLRDYYGNTEDKPNFRLVWADDELELRVTNYTPEGIQLLYPVIRQMRKYPDIRERYVLERLIPIIDFGREDGAPVEKLIYQAIWTFEIKNEQNEITFVAPNFGACKFVVETVMNAIAQRGNYTKYKDPESNPEEAAGIKEARIQGLMEDLFGNESAITDALSIRQGIAYGQGSSPNSSTPTFKDGK